MWQAILRALRIVVEVICSLCGTKIMSDIAKRSGWVKQGAKWLCPTCRGEQSR